MSNASSDWNECKLARNCATTMIWKAKANFCKTTLRKIVKIPEDCGTALKNSQVKV
jgi:hypothetical protein